MLPWTRLCGLEDAEAAARAISEKGDTGYSRGGEAEHPFPRPSTLEALLLDQFPGKAARKVIDISGNGENNDGLPVRLSRLNAIAKGYTINVIAIPAKDENPATSWHPILPTMSLAVPGPSY